MRVHTPLTPAVGLKMCAWSELLFGPPPAPPTARIFPSPSCTVWLHHCENWGSLSGGVKTGVTRLLGSHRMVRVVLASSKNITLPVLSSTVFTGDQGAW